MMMARELRSDTGIEALRVVGRGNANVDAT